MKDLKEEKTDKTSLIPLPHEIRFTGGTSVVTGETEITEEESSELPEEAYELKLENGRVSVKASSRSGHFYSHQTLRQLRAVCGKTCRDLVIRDAPLLPYRGFLIDSCRHFYSVEELKRVIDAAALFKLNTFHWHLTDDQGWRIEIKRYPILTQAGSVRRGSRFGGVDEGKEHRGFFTQEQIKEIVDYCAERFIEIVPEIDMPGHFTAALAAYPFLGCTGEPMEPAQKEGIYPNVLCVGNDDATVFIRDVLDEVCRLFPGKYIHIGGDEAPRTRWRECEKCSAKMASLGLRDFDALQGRFIKETADYLRKKGKTAVTWNESLKGGLLTGGDVTVQRWMDKDKLCRGFARAGGKVIESDFYHYYFDYPYGMTPLKKAFGYDPFRGLEKDSVIGVEGALWTEYVRTFDDLSQKLFPRLFVIAERGWSGAKSCPYSDFRTAAAALSTMLPEEKLSTLPPSYWDPGAAARIKQVVSFFKGSLTKDLLKQAFSKDK